MATRLELKEVCEAWVESEKTKSIISRRKASITKSSVVEESATEILVEQPTKRGRGRPKGKTKVVDAKKTKGNTKSLSTTTANIVLGCTMIVVPDVQELRRKMEEDTVACGRSVRSFVQTPTRISMPHDVVSNADVGQKNDDFIETAPRIYPSSSSKSTRIPTSAEYQKDGQEDGTIFKADAGEFKHESARLQHAGKEPSVDEFEESQYIAKSMPRPLSRKRHSVYIDIAGNLEDPVSVDKRQSWTRSPSPLQTKAYHCYEGGEPHRNDIDEDGRTDRQRPSHQFSSRTPMRAYSPSSRIVECRSSRRSHSRSPKRLREGRQHVNTQELPEYYEDSAYAANSNRDYGKSTGILKQDHQTTRKYYSLSPNRDRHVQRSHSPVSGGRRMRRSLSPYASRSPQRISGDSPYRAAPQWKGPLFVKQENIVSTSTSMSRRHRRHKEAIREEKMANRLSHGKKPFYLTLDPEGRPYGPGRPAWIAEITKLAIGLDPSCTHIRKQTFEDVQTFKDRLDESFDYSGILNEGYLRGLMGKAVTKKRGEFIYSYRAEESNP